MSDKIQQHHLDRRAILYIRQSSPSQIARNEESRRMQYGMQTRLHDLGWTDVDVIDEDLGITANGSAHRSGFSRLVADVCLGEVGVVAAREVSRFARNSRDWQQLVEMSRVVDTLLIDHDTVYDARRGNDRLLLGLKGSLNEYELDLLRLRAAEARNEKAKRGEFVAALPIGFVKSHKGEIELIADLRVQQAIKLVFSKFAELKSVRQTYAWFIEHNLKLPTQRHVDMQVQVIWRRPRYSAVYNILTNPVYAGAYVWGRTVQKVAVQNGVPVKSTHRQPQDQWSVLIPEHHEGYLDWQEYERLQKTIATNRRSPATTKKGKALLAGLLRCGRCGRKLQIAYTGRNGEYARYLCIRGALDTGEPRCIGFGGTKLDACVTQQILQVVKPARVEVALMAEEQMKQRSDEVLASLQTELKAVQYNADLAQRQYHLADPANRLVVDELERRWNASLETVKRIEQELACNEQSRSQNTPKTHDFSQLYVDLERIWDSPNTDPQVKKRIIHTLIQEISVDIEDERKEIVAVIYWKGGVHTEHRLQHRSRGQAGPHTSNDIVTTVQILNRICTDDVVASVLSRNGLTTGRGNRWTRERVQSMRTKKRIPAYSKKRQQEDGWLNLTDASRLLKISGDALRKVAEKGELPALHPLPIGPWIFNKADLETNKAKTVVEGIRSRRNGGKTRLANQQTLDFTGDSLDEFFEQ